MNLYQTVLFFHLIGAAIWTGGHLVLAIRVLPVALRTRSIEVIQSFEERFEGLGIPALLVQVATGLWLAHHWIPVWGDWVNFESPLSRAVLAKLSLLAITMALAADARLRIIPKLSPTTLPALAWHVVAVTLVSVLFVATGLSVRFGGF